MKSKLKVLSHELDHNVGNLNLKLYTLCNISEELGRIEDTFQNTDKTNLTTMGLTFRDVDSQIAILSDLLHYTVNDLKNIIEETRNIKESYFDFHVRGAEDEN